MKIYIVMEKKGDVWLPTVGVGPRLNRKTAERLCQNCIDISGKKFKVVPGRIKEKHWL